MALKRGSYEMWGGVEVFEEAKSGAEGEGEIGDGKGPF